MERIITRPDFDGVVCAVLLREGLGQHLPIQWVQPSEVQNRDFEAGPGDIIANLPLADGCAMWFDHHVSNQTQVTYEGLYRIAPSAAGLVYEYYLDRIGPKHLDLVRWADKIDDAQLSLDEILHPENYPFILLSMTISANTADDLAYCDDLAELLGTRTITDILALPQVKARCESVLEENKNYKKALSAHTRQEGMVSVSDFRGMDPVPNGNRFLIYSLFPETVVNMKIYHENTKTVVKLGHSILNRNCNVNVGKLLAGYGGGGHRGAGACRLEKDGSENKVQEILNILTENRA